MAPGPLEFTKQEHAYDSKGSLQNELLLKELLEGLYSDGLFPSLEVLGKRLLGQMKTRPEGTAKVTIQDLIQVARTMSATFEIAEDVSRSMTNAYSPVLLGRPSRTSVTSITFAKPPVGFRGFVDIDSLEDPYPIALWKSFEVYLENLARLVRSKLTYNNSSNRIPSAGNATSIDDTEGPHAFKGTSAEVASELKRRRLPFFDGFRLGDIQHIVQLALEKRKLLVLTNKSAIVPAAVFSKSGGLAESATGEKNTVRSRKELCEILQTVLSHCEAGLELSRLKEKVFETTGLRLEERLFECPKLLDVLRLPDVAQVCRFEKQEGKSTYRVFSQTNMRSYDDSASVNAGVRFQSPCAPPQQFVPECQQPGLQPHWPSEYFATGGAQTNFEGPSFACLLATLASSGSVGHLLPPGLHSPEEKIAMEYAWKEHHDLLLRQGEPAYIPVPMA
eukprot:CAMPEP_0169097446 /NCGR_PEP_ID=MMETSP1015-20121227/19526_1 /TAXON_ID=342587 /ORGANISM="Karlodinium micrum, Strain CCMP2283" /LENGTH=446 /DNA_ID=CAMNT_0009158257 /DNA_START=49 /DNA_END=1389 /DNA_ORIENTATION=-